MKERRSHESLERVHKGGRMRRKSSWLSKKGMRKKKGKSREKRRVR